MRLATLVRDLVKTPSQSMFRETQYSRLEPTCQHKVNPHSCVRHTSLRLLTKRKYKSTASQPTPILGVAQCTTRVRDASMRNTTQPKYKSTASQPTPILGVAQCTTRVRDASMRNTTQPKYKSTTSLSSAQTRSTERPSSFRFQVVCELSQVKTHTRDFSQLVQDAHSRSEYTPRR